MLGRYEGLRSIISVYARSNRNSQVAHIMLFLAVHPQIKQSRVSTNQLIIMVSANSVQPCMSLLGCHAEVAHASAAPAHLDGAGESVNVLPARASTWTRTCSPVEKMRQYNSMGAFYGSESYCIAWGCVTAELLNAVERVSCQFTPTTLLLLRRCKLCLHPS